MCRMKLRVIGCLVLLLAGQAAIANATTVTWDAYDDFGGTNPSGEWSYLVMSETGSAALDTWTTININGNADPVWQNPAYVIQDPASGKLIQSAGMTSYANPILASVVQFTAPYTGVYTASAVMERREGGVFLDIGKNMTTTDDCFPKSICNLYAPFTSTWGTTLAWNDSNLALTAGDTIQFVVLHQGTMDPGSPGTGNSFLTATFTTDVVPEPSSIVLGVSSLIGLLAYAWRKRK